MPSTHLDYLANIEKAQTNKLAIALLAGALLTLPWLAYFFGEQLFSAYQNAFVQIALTMHPPSRVEEPFAVSIFLVHIFPLLITLIAFVAWLSLHLFKSADERRKSRARIVCNEVLLKGWTASGAVSTIYAVKVRDVEELSPRRSSEDYFDALFAIRIRRATLFLFAPITAIFLVTLVMDIHGYTAVGAQGIERNHYSSFQTAFVPYGQVSDIEFECHYNHGRDRYSQIRGWLPYLRLNQDGPISTTLNLKRVTFVGARPSQIIASIENAALTSGASLSINGLPVPDGTRLIVVDHRCNRNLERIFGTAEAAAVARALYLRN